MGMAVTMFTDKELKEHDEEIRKQIIDQLSREKEARYADDLSRAKVCIAELQALVASKEKLGQEQWREIKMLRAQVPGDTMVREFCGFISSHIPQLHHVPVPEIAAAWETFKERRRMDAYCDDHAASALQAKEPVYTSDACGPFNASRVVPPSIQGEAEAFWRQVYLKAFSGHDPKGTAAACADYAVQEWLVRYVPDKAREKHGISITRLAATLRNILTQRAAEVWRDPNCCERRAVTRLVGSGEAECFANSLIDFIRDDGV
jgi:hypothetical protein